ncbi:hypothetical protein HK105_202568 [Polyrhizophydium stewartii]|uniref:Uncharacterized protein n=1 Tax=Polyrhizophydium stewartii TaxID=2732419 RepID=A0ABR4NDV0_9FUNG
MRVYDDPNQLRRKLVMVGEGNSGKTSMLMVLAGQPFPEEYVPTLFDSQIARIAVGGNKIVEMSLWDTAGQEEYDRLRPLSYPDTDVAIICFSVDTHELDTVIDKWDPETKHFLPNVPRLLVATKKDLRENPAALENMRIQGITPVSYEEGLRIANQIGAAKYMECSAKTGEGIHEIFTVAAKLALKPRRRMNKCKLV